jgi:two-component system, sensor histidine kinase and response regulator
VTESLLAGPRPGPEAPAAPAVSAPLCVLLADDNPVNQALVRGFLERQGHTVATAGTGREALAALEGGGFDLVLMDVEMPEMGGLEAAAELRRREREAGRPRLPVVAVTAHAMKGDRERCLAAGMDGYVAKPIRPEELRHAIESVLGGAGGAPAEGSGAAGPEAFDRRAALAGLDNDESLLQKVAELFGRECPRLLGAVRAAVQEKDARRLERAAHALKGSVGLLHARRATEAAPRLELLGQGGDLGKAGEALAELEDALARLDQALAAFRAGATP